jgi:hypothetical protein
MVFTNRVTTQTFTICNGLAFDGHPKNKTKERRHHRNTEVA